ncbi:MAG: HEAT repeat domain-containing protein [Planctomycetes bacterium]|nr:HEAT repeat domain-containing protein [Planctomycetota bacterium]
MSGAPAPLGEGWFAWADPEGRLLLGRRMEDRLELCRVYRLVVDARRHAAEPGQVAPHGVYLDDLGEEMEARRTELGRALREVAARVPGGTAEAAEAREWAEELARLGGDRVLLDLLQSGGSEARRAAAVALGLHGHPEAHPVLLRMLEAPDPRTRSSAARALSALTGRAGQPAPDGSLDVGLVAGWEAWRPVGPGAEGDGLDATPGPGGGVPGGAVEGR